MMPTTAQKLLAEIVRATEADPAHKSRERGKWFYESEKFPQALSDYINKHHGGVLAKAERHLKISSSTLRSMMTGTHISENMLFRLRIALERDLAQRPPSDDPSPQWRKVRTSTIQSLIAEVADRLIILKKAITDSNSLNSSNPPIDPIHKAQLIALLESTLAALKAPYVETGQLKRFMSFLRKTGGKLLAKSADGVAKKAIDSVIEKGADLLAQLDDAPSIADINDLIV